MATERQKFIIKNRQLSSIDFGTSIDLSLTCDQAILFSIREGGPYEHRLTCPDIKPQHMHIRSWWVRCAIENLSCLSAVWVAGQSQNCSLCVRRLG